MSKSGRFIVLHPVTGARFCHDKRWREFTFSVLDVKVYKLLGHAIRVATTSKLHTADWPEATPGVVVNIPENWGMDAAGVIWNDKYERVASCSQLAADPDQIVWPRLVVYPTTNNEENE